MTRKLAQTIETPEQSSSFSLRPNKVLFLDRKMNYEVETEKIVAYAGGWCIFRNMQDGAHISFKHKGKWNSLTMYKNYLAIIPPYSLVHWRFPRGETRIQMYYWMSEFPDYLNSYAAIYPSYEKLPEDPKQWLSKVKESGSGIPLFLENKKSIVAENIKSKICQDYASFKTISQSMKEIGYSSASASRCFKNSYGITLVEYRNKLRFMRAQELLLISKTSVTETALAVGFSDLRQFQRNFLQIAKTTPSKFKILKRFK